MRTPCWIRASASFSFGTIKYSIPAVYPEIKAPNTPRTGRTRPDSSNSPITITGVSSAQSACNTARAIGRSNPLPSFFWSAGLKLISIRSCGKGKSELLIAVRIRSRASFTADPGSPTISIIGRPRRKSASTLIISPS